MRLDRWIILFLLVALCAVGFYYAASQIGFTFATSSGPTIQFTLPTGSGLSVGQAIAVAGQPTANDVGQIKEILPNASGVLVTVSLHGGQTLPSEARIICRPGTPPRPATLELAGGAGVTRVPEGIAVRIPAILELGAPEGLVEPMAEWPLETP